MSNLKSITSSKLIKLSGASDPTESVSAKIKEGYRNTTSGELFSTDGAGNWYGSQNGLVLPSILSTTHPDLVAMYTMDNISGSTLVDESPNGNDGVITEAVSATGVIGDALSFDGIDDYVSLPTSSVPTGELSFSLWVKFKTLSGDKRFLAVRQDNPVFNFPKFRLRTSGLILDAQVALSGGSTVSEFGHTEVATSQYYHIAFLINNSSAELFINGVSVGSSSGAPELNGITIGAYIGASRNGDTNAHVDIDQLRIFNRALTQEEITTLYNEGL